MDSDRPAHPHPRRSGFDRLARAYRWLEYLTFGRALERCRGAWLGSMGQARQALVLGDGDGRFAARLLTTAPALRMLAVDTSAAMLAALRRRAEAAEAGARLVACQRDALEMLRQPACASGAAAAPFDLVVSHFFLDCFSTAEVGAMAEGVGRRLAPGGQWVVSEFETPAPWARAIVALLYAGFALLTGLKTTQLPAWRSALREAGWTLAGEQVLLRGLLASTVWRRTGAWDGRGYRPVETGDAGSRPGPAAGNHERACSTPTKDMTSPQAALPYLFDTIPGIDPGPVPWPVPGFDPTPGPGTGGDPEPEPDYDPEVDPDPVLPPGPATPGPDPGFPGGPFTDPLVS